MIKKKELNLEELEKVSGGVFSEEAQVYYYINAEKISQLISNDERRISMFKFIYELNQKGSMQDLSTLQTILRAWNVDTNQLQSYDSTNPEHVKILEELRSYKD